MLIAVAVAVATVVVASLLPSPDCAALRAPVEGPIQHGFAPVGLYGGHWERTSERRPALLS